MQTSNAFKMPLTIVEVQARKKEFATQVQLSAPSAVRLNVPPIATQKSLEISVKATRTVSPNAVKATIPTRETREAISPYSIAVAPDSSAKNVPILIIASFVINVTSNVKQLDYGIAQLPATDEVEAVYTPPAPSHN